MGNQAGIIIRNVKNELFHSAKRLILNEVKGIECLPMVMGKKAYLFCQTDEACERAAMMYSFFGACKVKGKNPERWLAYVLDHIGRTKDEDLYKLLPEFWEDIN